MNIYFTDVLGVNVFVSMSLMYTVMFPRPAKEKPNVSGETFTCLPLKHAYKRRLLTYMRIIGRFMSESVMID